MEKWRTLGEWYSSEEFESKYTYDEENLGAEWTKDATTFRVFAPTAEKVVLNLYTGGKKGVEDLIEKLPMEQGDKGVWMTVKEGDLNGTYYTFSVTVEGKEREACDPYAKTVGVNGERAMVIDLASTNPEGWAEDKNPNAALKINDVVIYEAHIRDMTIHAESGAKNKGKFLGLAEEGTVNSAGDSTGLDYIASLGVTHVHLLPFYDYASVDEENENGKEYNWGYDPKNYSSPEGSYSTDPYHGEVRVKELKQMIQAFHRKGLSVVMDVVYNHVDDAETFCYNQIVPGFFSRIDKDGVYSNGCYCGNDTASERAMIHKYIVESVVYWAKEYHIDGFRFDLVGLLDVDTICDLVKRVHEIRPDVIFYGEGWTLPTVLTKEVTLATQIHSNETPGFAYFSDNIRNLIRGSNFEVDEKGYVYGEKGIAKELQQNMMGMPEWAISPTQVVNYASCHDDHTLYDKLQDGDPEADREKLIRYNKLAAAIVFAAEGIPFIHAGEELLRTKVNEKGEIISNSYNAGDFVNAFAWDKLQDKDCVDVKNYYMGLMAFRKEHPVLRLSDTDDIKKRFTFADIKKGETIAYSVDCTGVTGEIAKELYFIFHPETEACEIQLPEGEWEIQLNESVSGTKALETVSGSVTVPAISAMYLVRK